MIDKILTGYAAKALYDRLRPDDKTAPGSKEEIRDGNNVGMEDGKIENHSYDLSARDAINLMQQRKAEGKPVTGDDMKDIFKALADSGQITREEWMDLREYVTANYNNLSPEAKAAFDKFDTAIQDKGNKVGWFDGKKDGATRADAVFKGADLKAFLDGLDAPAKKDDGVHPQTGGGGGGVGGANGGGGGTNVKPPENHAPSGSDGPSKAPGAPGPNASWSEIIFYIMGLLNEKTKALKEKATALGKELGASKQKDAAAAKGETGGTTSTEGGAGAKSADGTGTTDDINTELLKVQDEVKKLDQMTEMLTNLLSSTHQTTSKIVGNIR
jgi:hypothetical protein